MHNYTLALVVAFVLAVTIVVAPAIYADDGQMQHGGMMKMMQQMSRMMDHCNNMMGSRGSGRPNEQWRRRWPIPDNKG